MRIREGCEEPYIEFQVDGVDLGAILATAFRATLPDGVFEDVLPWYGVDFDPFDTVLSPSVLEHGSLGALLLVCGCGCSACGSVSARVTVTDRDVTWSAFKTHFAGQLIEADVSPIRVDRSQFDAELAHLHLELQAFESRRTALKPTPPPTPPLITPPPPRDDPPPI
jgi:hypothetical protein